MGPAVQSGAFAEMRKHVHRSYCGVPGLTLVGGILGISPHLVANRAIKAVSDIHYAKEQICISWYQCREMAVLSMFAKKYCSAIGVFSRTETEKRE